MIWDERKGEVFHSSEKLLHYRKEVWQSNIRWGEGEIAEER